MISQHSIDQLRTQLDVVDVISNYIELRKSGANFKAPCPFHSEDSPSFVVSPAKQIYHCFGCGVGGDSIKFVMEYEKLSYPEAIEKLAAEFNFRLEYTDNSPKRIDTKVMEDLHSWYKRLLDANVTAMKYLQERGVFESSIETFGIAYAPNSNETLQYLQQSHANINEAVELGLVGYESGRYFARFIDRIIFPIYAQNGKLVGFGGRTISGHQAKYVNSPQTKIFNKSKLLYAYNLARDAIYKQKQMIVTEGYLDVVMLHQAGFTNAVATLGTALTTEHIPLLRKGDPKIIMAYDGDAAGINAALKAARMLSASGIDGGVVLFGEGMDPADMVKEDRTGELKQLFLNAKKMPNFVLEVIVGAYDLNDPREKERALHDAAGYLKTLSPILQEEYKQLLAALLKISPGLIHLRPGEQSKGPKQYIKDERDIWELTLIKTLLEKPQFIETVIDHLDVHMLSHHNQEYAWVLQSQREHPALVRISLDDSIKIFDDADLKKELLGFLSNYYNKELKKVRSEAHLGFEEKRQKLRFFQEKIAKLKEGKLVSL